MCMKSVNATIDLFASVKTGDCEVFSMPFDTIRCIIEENILYISDFYIVSNFNLMGTTDAQRKVQNIVENLGNLQCLIRLTKISGDPKKRLSWDIDRFDIDCSNKENRFEEACVACVNFKKITKVNRIVLSDEYIGQYALKVLVRCSDEDKWEVQTIKRLTVIQ